jgi:hypothetical protein
MKGRVLMSMMMVGLLCAGPLGAVENKEPKTETMAPKTAVTGSRIDTSGPRIEIKDMRHDFGKVVKGTKVEYVFEIKNVGNEELVIQKVQPS